MLFCLFFSFLIDDALQRNSRLILFEEFCKRSNCVLNDWDCDMEKIQSIEDELSVSNAFNNAYSLVSVISLPIGCLK